MAQLDIFSPPSAIDAAFWTFHEANGHVYTRLVSMTEQAKRAGLTRVGMKQLFEVLRWNHALRTSGDPFLLNNSFTSRYVRIIQERRPDLADMFEVRRLHS